MHESIAINHVTLKRSAILGSKYKNTILQADQARTLCPGARRLTISRDPLLMDFTTYEAITRLRYTYAVSIDTRDWPLHRSIYTDEITMDFTSYSGGEGATTMSADAWVGGLKPLFTGLSATQHVMTNPLVAVDGARATQRMYMKAEHFLIEDGRQGEFAIGGYYDDTLVKTADGWRIDGVTLTVLWRRGEPAIMERARILGEAAPGA